MKNDLPSQESSLNYSLFEEFVQTHFYSEHQLICYFFKILFKSLTLLVLIYQICRMELNKELKPEKVKLFAALLRKKRERDADILLEEQLTKNEGLSLGLNHNKFGAFCLTADKLDKAEQHLFKALELISKQFPCSNVFMNIGNLYAQRRNYQQAINFYEKVIKCSPYREGYEDDLGELVYCSKLNSFDAYVDAHTNIAVMLVQTNKVQQGLRYCEKALQLRPNNTEAQINFTDFLRQVGKKEQAIKHTWNQIVLYTQKNKDEKYQGFTPLKINPWKPKQQLVQSVKQINVLCVKWGTRYNAAYVNKLYGSMARNTTWKMNFYCFTDDSKDLHPNIKPVQLEQGWKGWWGKVTLFGLQMEGRNFYIDLDMVITGSLDELFAYDGEFATLRTDDLVCQKNHKGGYNSSVMIWQGNYLKSVYNALKENFDCISKFIVRFDFWLQMTIQNADIVQLIYPGKCVDFLGECQEKIPEGAAIVCFARKPKPEDYPAEWIKQHWIQ